MNDLEQTIREIFANHEVTCLIDNDEIEAWRFMKPDTRDCQIDIMMTKYGMAMVGDYGDFTFYVGRSYGMAFLANPSKGYVAQKIHPECKKYDLDKPRMYEICLEEVKEYLSEKLEDNDFKENINEQLNLRALGDYLENMFSNCMTGSGNDYNLVDDMITFISDVKRLEEVDEAHHYFYEQDWLQDTFEWDLKVLDRYTQGRIWAMHVMAEKVLEYKSGKQK